MELQSRERSAGGDAILAQINADGNMNTEQVAAKAHYRIITGVWKATVLG